MKCRAACKVVEYLFLGLFASAQTPIINPPTPFASAAVADRCSPPARSGGGKKNYVPLWISSTKLGISALYQTGENVGVGTTAPAATLDVHGTVNAATSFNLGGSAFVYGSSKSQNVFLGFAGNSTMSGPANTASGASAFASNTGGQLNTADGYKALNSNTTANWNTASGAFALYYNTVGQENTANGEEALISNTTGDYNTASGFQALYQSTTGNWNTGCGSFALFANGAGDGNVGAGYGALENNNGGSWNTASGLSALSYNATGSYNTALGYDAGPDSNSPNLINATAIGANAMVSESNALVLGGTGNYAVKVGIGTATPSHVFTIAKGAGHAVADGWQTYSSRRSKTNIQTIHGSLGKIEQLRGVSYDSKASGKHEMGVIAEEVGAVVPEVVTWDNNGKDAQSVDYSRLTALLIEATKQQQALIRGQQEQINVQQRQIARLTSQVRMIQGSFESSGGNGGEVRAVKGQANLLPTGRAQ
jgi:hypothetical protein